MKSLALALTLLASSVVAAPVGPLSTYLVDPCRLFDTREASGNHHRLTTLDYTVHVQGYCGVPIGARGVILNVTAINPDSSGHISLYAWDAPKPTTSTLNFAAGQTVANEATVRLKPLTRSGADLTFSLALASGASDFTVDVVGYLR